MNKKEVEYLQSLLEIFRVEAQEHLSAISSGLMELEKADAGTTASVIENIYREAHSLKGAARAVNMIDLESLCQRMESVFSEMKRTGSTGSPQLLDALHSAVNELDTILGALHSPRSIAEKARTEDLARELERAALSVFGPSIANNPRVATPKRTPERPARSPQPAPTRNGTTTNGITNGATNGTTNGHLAAAVQVVEPVPAPDNRTHAQVVRNEAPSEKKRGQDPGATTASSNTSSAASSYHARRQGYVGNHTGINGKT